MQDFVDINRLEKVIRFIKVRASGHAELLAAGNRGGCAELWKSFLKPWTADCLDLFLIFVVLMIITLSQN